MLQQKLRLKLHKELFIKAQKIDLSCYDDPEYYNDFVWAMQEADQRLAQTVAGFLGKQMES